MSVKVLHFHFGKEGGAERFFVNLAQAFDHAGFEQRFVIRPNRTWDAEISALGPVIRNNFTRISPLSLLLHMQVEVLVRRWKPDAVMAWMPRAARLMHDWEGCVKLTRLGDFPSHLRHFKNCDVIVGNIPAINETCVKLGWARPTKTISNFPRRVTPVPVERATLQTPDSAYLVATAGRLHARKGFDTLIRAVAAIPGAFLWIAGDGPERGPLEVLARELGMAGRIRFTGWIAEPIHYLAAADAFVMPSRHEPLGNILLEAWHAGVPSVSTRSEGPSWYMRDGVDGLMVDIDDVPAMSAALMRLRDDPTSATAYVQNARERLEQMFSEKAVVAAYREVFTSRRGDSAR
jgi:glycosyltransferase involved in cell wall biosynthesis